jgi:anti-sigma factor RsiW
LLVNFNVKTKTKINGAEYARPDEMPSDVRSLYEKALAGRDGSSPSVQVMTNSKITFNGQTFTSADEMPEDARRIYESVMTAVDKTGSILTPRRPTTVM